MPATPAVARARRTVLLGAVLVLALKLVMAATTYGTRDINHWRDFVGGVAAHGPVGIYGVRFTGSFYNHPPLVGYLLELVQVGVQHGVSVQFSVRALASLADVASALLVFEMLWRRATLHRATLAALAVAASPVLFVISGFHGNTDPLFMTLVLLAVFLLADLDRPGWAGVALALAVGIKIVPVVVGPALLVLAIQRGRRPAATFVTGFALTFLVTWLPALLTHGREIRTNVLGYAGSSASQWGLSQLGHWASDPFWARYLVGDGRFLVVLLCAALPALVVWRRPGLAVEAVALAMIGFLVLTPAFGTQYLVWAVAPAYLVRSHRSPVFSVTMFGATVFGATAFNLGAGLLLVVVYTRWDGGLPWDFARIWGLDRAEVAGALVVWVILGAVLVDGTRSVLGQLRSQAPA